MDSNSIWTNMDRMWIAYEQQKLGTACIACGQHMNSIWTAYGQLMDIIRTAWTAYEQA
jgi:hypothetical protein